MLIRPTLMVVLTIALYLNVVPTVAGETQCFGVGGSVLEGSGAQLKMDIRFEHCKKGDVISVYTKSLNSTEGDATDINAFAMRINEVTEFCDFAYPIVPIGATQLPKYGLTTHWFSCVYLGSRRAARFHEGSQ